MKKILAAVAVILWTIAILKGVKMYTGEEKEQVIQAFHSMSMGQEQSKVSSYGLYQGDYLTVEEQKLLLKTIANGLGIVDNYSITEENGQYGRKLLLFLDGVNADTQIAFYTTETPQTGNVYEVSQYVKVDITIEDSLESAFYYQDKVAVLMNRYVENPQNSIRIQGNYAGCLSIEEKDVIVMELLDSLNADIVAEHRQDTYVIYAYTSKLNEYKEVGKEKVNLTIAVSYNETENNTQMILATPLLNEDF
ncbi:MAG: YwmB family TATA-box binding protein [Lachnospiraceae bacterium]|nr:YwmB family TATA-box binding protein [Lachnospiraceae bacterium]